MFFRLLITVFFTLISITNLFAQSNQVLYNWQKNGLRLRSEPYSLSKAITKMPYGAKLEVLEVLTSRPFVTNLFTAKRICEKEEGVVIKNYELKGNWLKIKYNDSIAYVASSYLSPLKTIPLQTDDLGPVMYDKQKMEKVLISYFGMPIKRSKKNTAKEKGEEAYNETFVFANNIIVVHDLQYLDEGIGGEEYKISIPGRKIMDVLWLGIVLAQNGETDKSNYCYVESDENNVKLEHYGEGQTNVIEIKQEKDRVVLSVSFGGC